MTWSTGAERYERGELSFGPRAGRTTDHMAFRRASTPVRAPVMVFHGTADAIVPILTVAAGR